jgi:hypothetical protein
MLGKLLMIVIGLFVMAACVGAIFLAYEEWVEEWKRKMPG